MENLNVAMCMEIHVWLNGLNVFKPFWQLLSAACNSARRLVVKTSYFPFRRDNAFGGPSLIAMGDIAIATK